MTLVDGEELLRIIGSGLHGEALELPAPAARSSTPACPACGAAMVRRTARQGAACRTRLLGVLDLSCVSRNDTPIADEAIAAL